MERGFLPVKDSMRKTDGDIHLPTRATEHSAGHDFYSPVDVTLYPWTPTVVWTDVKAYMPENEVLLLFVRSSMGKIPVVLANGTGIIDADYFGNDDNDGNIGVMLLNMRDSPYNIKKGDRIAQGVFVRYFAVEQVAGAQRKGGFGST